MKILVDLNVEDFQMIKVIPDLNQGIQTGLNTLPTLKNACPQ